MFDGCLVVVCRMFGGCLVAAGWLFGVFLVVVCGLKREGVWCVCVCLSFVWLFGGCLLCAGWLVVVCLVVVRWLFRGSFGSCLAGLLVDLRLVGGFLLYVCLLFGRCRVVVS